MNIKSLLSGVALLTVFAAPVAAADCPINRAGYDKVTKVRTVRVNWRGQGLKTCTSYNDAQTRSLPWTSQYRAINAFDCGGGLRGVFGLGGWKIIDSNGNAYPIVRVGQLNADVPPCYWEGAKYITNDVVNSRQC